MSCTFLNDYLYISSYSEDCIYISNVNTGSTIAKHGQYGKNAPDELYHPTTIYTDQNAHTLLVLDCWNNRLQTFEPSKDGKNDVTRLNQGKWAIIETDHKFKLERPFAAALLPDETIWISSASAKGNKNYLYKCCLTSACLKAMNSLSALF